MENRIYTFLQLQNRVLRRAGRSVESASGSNSRENVKDILQDIYDDINSRRQWKHLFITEELTFSPSTHTKIMANLFQSIDNVWTNSGDTIIHLNPSTRLEFNRFIKDGTGGTSTFPNRYFIVGAASDPAKEFFMNAKMRIYPMTSAAILINIDGRVWPKALVDDEDKPMVTPILQIALIRGAVATVYDQDEDARADSVFLKYESDIEKALILEDVNPDDFATVGPNLESDSYDRPRYPWEVA